MFKRPKPTPSVASLDLDALQTEWLHGCAIGLAEAGNPYADVFARMVSEEASPETDGTPGSDALHRSVDDYELVPMKVFVAAAVGLLENYPPQVALRVAAHAILLATRWEDYLIALGEHPRWVRNVPRPAGSP